MKITKKELAKKLSEKSGIPANKAQSIINDLTGIIKEEINLRNEIIISNFGSFGSKVSQKETRYDFQKREMVEFSPKSNPYFKPSTNWNEQK